ncbi:1,4-alpha-glucan branching protein GlgB [Candidatus Ventrimonas sp. KK005]|nr:1,4-alpha-glucan branching protein GlgB [Lachnospiraceae bacterium]NBH18217.1 1,4-alpha-glucan branching protein GlgB [Clostridiaceae bacterium]
MAGKNNQKITGTGLISEMDRYLFGQGTHYEIYEKLGAHPRKLKGKDGFYFAVWAPHAVSVSVVGDFNKWDPEANPMTVLDTSGIYECFIPDLTTGQLYKYAITTKAGKLLFKADPYAYQAEFRPGTASITSDISSFKWGDDSWMKKRGEQIPEESPMSIYEVHLGSWKKKNRPEKEGYYTYKEAAFELAEYVKTMGYTHVELMGIAEHPFDGSWGYQVTGYYAPTSRYGTPQEFMYFVNYLHKKGIGVILDWVPAHFPRDAHGLADFDGEPLYEYADSRKGEHPDWGTKVFDYEKHEVSNFLIANALYWIKEYHIDGLRVDAVASMLYLDYGRKDGQWIANKYGGNQNLEAIEFFRHLNSIVKTRGNGAMVIAEESTAWPSVTHAPEENGLGFTFKWNMGWMHDFLEYMKLDPYFRKYNHNKMTFGLTYFTSENFILVLSHDEVVHLKCSMINKMPGYYSDKFANLKAGYTFMFGHPGKKLLFMGQDFGQLHEWDEKVSLDWHLTEEDEHKSLQAYVRDLLHIYTKYPAMYEADEDWEGFQWINANDGDRSIFSFMRRAKDLKKSLLFVCSFTPMERPDYQLGVPKKGTYTLLLDNKHGLYQPSEKPPVFRAVKQECDGQPYCINLPLPAYGTAILRFT